MPRNDIIICARRFEPGSFVTFTTCVFDVCAGLPVPLQQRIHLEVDYAVTALQFGRTAGDRLATRLLWWIGDRRAVEYLAVGAGDRDRNADTADVLQQLR